MMAGFENREKRREAWNKVVKLDLLEFYPDRVITFRDNNKRCRCCLFMVKTIHNEWSENKNLVAKVSSNYFNKDTDGGDIENMMISYHLGLRNTMRVPTENIALKSNYWRFRFTFATHRNSDFIDRYSRLSCQKTWFGSQIRCLYFYYQGHG